MFPNPTTAINNILKNLILNEGDEVLMTQHEYGALVRAWDYASKLLKSNMNKDLALIQNESNCLELILSNVVWKIKFWIYGYRL